MSKADRVYDLIVIGTGVAASTAAWECHSAGWKIAIIDSRPFGGTCNLRGCDPKKVLVGAAEVIDWNHRMGDKGINNTKDIRIKWPELMRFKRSFTEPVPKAREDQFYNAGIDAFRGHASFTDTSTIKVTEKNGGGADHALNAKHILVATGAKPAKLNIPGEEHVTISDQFLELDYLPDRIVFIGGGYISFEFAHIAARAGAKKITILHRSNKPLGQFDPDLVSQLIQSTRELGIDVRLQTEVKGIVKSSDNGLTVNAFYVGEKGNRSKEDHIIETDMVVHGAGRVPDVETLDLEAAGIEYDKKKGIKVNEYLQSVSNPAIYAAGDVVVGGGGPQLTPIATYHAIENLVLHLIDIDWEPVIYFPSLASLFAASRINWATSFGCDNGDAWLDGSEIVVALICFANIRSTTGGIRPSFSETWYQLGSCCQAGGPEFSARIDLLYGFCVAAKTLA
jgi:glutathione reductase (NADPH)